MERVKTIAWLGVLAGFAISTAWYAGWLRPTELIVSLAFLLLFGGGAILLLTEAWEWFRRRLPTTERRQKVEEEAASLGLLSVERDTSALDLSFPLLRGRGAGYFADEMSKVIGGIFHPPFDWIFAGMWRGLDVRVFDYSDSRRNPRVDWTCAQLPIDADVGEIQITRETTASRLKSVIGRKDVTLGAQEFDRAFRIRANDKEAARRVLDASVRTRLLEDAPAGEVAIQLRGRRMLYCFPRLDIAERNVLLEVAKALRDSLPSSSVR